MKLLVLVNENPFEVSSASANRWRTIIEGLADLGVEIHLLVLHGYQSVQERRKYKREGQRGNISFYYSIFLLHSTKWWSRLSDYVIYLIFGWYNNIIARKIFNLVGPDIVFIYPANEVFHTFKTLSKNQRNTFLSMIRL